MQCGFTTVLCLTRFPKQIQLQAWLSSTTQQFLKLKLLMVWDSILQCMQGKCSQFPWHRVYAAGRAPDAVILLINSCCMEGHYAGIFVVVVSVSRSCVGLHSFQYYRMLFLLAIQLCWYGNVIYNLSCKVCNAWRSNTRLNKTQFENSFKQMRAWLIIPVDILSKVLLHLCWYLVCLFVCLKFTAHTNGPMHTRHHCNMVCFLLISIFYKIVLNIPMFYSTLYVTLPPGGNS